MGKITARITFRYTVSNNKLVMGPIWVHFTNFSPSTLKFETFFLLITGLFLLLIVYFPHTSHDNKQFFESDNDFTP